MLSNNNHNGSSLKLGAAVACRANSSPICSLGPIPSVDTGAAIRCDTIAAEPLRNMKRRSMPVMILTGYLIQNNTRHRQATGNDGGGTCVPSAVAPTAEPLSSPTLTCRSKDNNHCRSKNKCCSLSSRTKHCLAPSLVNPSKTPKLLTCPTAVQTVRIATS